MSNMWLAFDPDAGERSGDLGRIGRDYTSSKKNKTQGDKPHQCCCNGEWPEPEAFQNPEESEAHILGVVIVIVVFIIHPPTAGSLTVIARHPPRARSTAASANSIWRFTETITSPCSSSIENVILRGKTANNGRDVVTRRFTPSSLSSTQARPQASRGSFTHPFGGKRAFCSSRPTHGFRRRGPSERQVGE